MMMVSKIETQSKINSTLSVLLNELAEECETVLFLLTQLKLPNLTDDQKGDILAELTGAVSHLHVHTEDLPDLIGDEIETLPDEEEDLL
ncbi:hypothetical protein [Argonema galeatum]|uniref:hypothetical protein n=1 Tax=Argonema galeatum TaxID=2942762 RepID=UPI0020134A1F|nr:hypothetical protein [Argonema galeatum]MCL1464046.1 hypothetical protein [Argonema galeatum A003/A1]